MRGSPPATTPEPTFTPTPEPTPTAALSIAEQAEALAGELFNTLSQALEGVESLDDITALAEIGGAATEEVIEQYATLPPASTNRTCFGELSGWLCRTDRHPGLLCDALTPAALPSKPRSEFIKSLFTKPVRCHERREDEPDHAYPGNSYGCDNQRESGGDVSSIISLAQPKTANKSSPASMTQSRKFASCLSALETT